MTVHANPDDGGLGGTPASVKGGSAGPRLACCNIQTVNRRGFKEIKFSDYLDKKEPESEDADG